MKLIRCLLPLVGLIVTSCSSPAGEVNENHDDSLKDETSTVQQFERGKIYHKVICTSNPVFSYALYLPYNYDTINYFPAIIFFDPHAKASLPVSNYQSIADSLGIILAASNESKNGLKGGIYADICRAIAGDLTNRFRIERNRVYTAGFSGGARVALSIAVADTTIAGVICNSAGFDPAHSPLKNGFVMAGLAGVQDFNWLEQQRTSKSLGMLPVEHCMIEFQAGHQWAPHPQMNDAIIFLECAAIRKGIKSRNMNYLARCFKNDLLFLNKIMDKEEKYKSLQLFVATYKEIFDVKKQQEDLSYLNVSEWNLIRQKQEEAALAKEAVLQRDLYEKIFSQTAEWWTKAAERMRSVNITSDDYNRNHRLLGYISLAVYMTLVSPEAQQDAFLSEKLIAIYEAVDPENSEWAFQKAVLRARQGNQQEAVNLLIKAIDLGFSDEQRLGANDQLRQTSSNPAIRKKLDSLQRIK